MPMTRIPGEVCQKGSLVAMDSNGVTTDSSRRTMRIRLEAIIPVVGAGWAGSIDGNESQRDKLRIRFDDS